MNFSYETPFLQKWGKITGTPFIPLSVIKHLRLPHRHRRIRLSDERLSEASRELGRLHLRMAHVAAEMLRLRRILVH